MRTVASYLTVEDAEIARGRLASFNIQATVMEHFDPYPGIREVHLQVAGEDYRTALKIIKDTPRMVPEESEDALSTSNTCDPGTPSTSNQLEQVDGVTRYSDEPRCFDTITSAAERMAFEPCTIKIETQVGFTQALYAVLLFGTAGQPYS